MDDAQFEAFMKRLNRVVDQDAKGTTRLGQRYTSRDAPQSDHTADKDFHDYNNEWSKT